MDMMDVKAWVDIAKGAVDLLKSAASALPKGTRRDEIETKISVAEDALARSDAKLARDLGMKLCDCTFPPQIMLWREAEKAHVCPRSQCGRAVKRSVSVSRAALNASRKPKGPDSWMGS